MEGALNSREALIAAGLNWNVVQRKIFTQEGFPVEGYYANVRDKDQKVLGVVTSRYQIVQNREAFAFKDELLGKGVQYETAGSLKDGRKTWILAGLPKTYQLAEMYEIYLKYEYLDVGTWKGIEEILNVFVEELAKLGA